MKRWLSIPLAALCLAGILVNLLAWHHAGSFFQYAEGDARTPPPEALSAGEKLKVLLTGIRIPKPRAHSRPTDYGLIAESITVPGHAGQPLAGWHMASTASNAPLVLLFHGYSSEKSGLLPEAQAFARLGLELVMLDFPGHGDSPGRQTTLGYREAADVAAALAWAQQRWPDRRIILYGHSMGAAAIARATGLLGAQPNGIILESVFDTLLEAIRFRFRLMSVPPTPLAEIFLFWGSVRLGLNGFDHNITAYAAAIDSVPVLMLHGTNDQRAPVAAAERVYAALAAPKRLVLIEAAGHVNPCLKQPALWQEVVGGFIATRAAKVDAQAEQ
jgi:uncharacterized protein